MIATYFGVAHPWLCDSMGHLNTRNYVGMFDDASAHYLTAIGWSPAAAEEDNKGWADVKGEIEYKSEVPSGRHVSIQTGTAAIGTKSLTIYSEMRDSVSGELCATMKTVMVHFDTAERRAIVIPGEFRAKAEEFAI